MRAEKIHSRYVVLYEFRKDITIETAIKNTQNVYQYRASIFQVVKIWFGKFRHGDFQLNDEPHSD